MGTRAGTAKQRHASRCAGLCGGRSVTFSMHTLALLAFGQSCAEMRSGACADVCWPWRWPLTPALLCWLLPDAVAPTLPAPSQLGALAYPGSCAHLQQAGMLLVLAYAAASAKRSPAKGLLTSSMQDTKFRQHGLLVNKLSTDASAALTAQRHCVDTAA